MFTVQQIAIMTSVNFFGRSFADSSINFCLFCYVFIYHGCIGCVDCTTLCYVRYIDWKLGFSPVGQKTWTIIIDVDILFAFSVNVGFLDFILEAEFSHFVHFSSKRKFSIAYILPHWNVQNNTLLSCGNYVSVVMMTASAKTNITPLCCQEDQIKFPTKCIFRIFYIWKTNRMMLFCNLFVEWPSVSLMVYKRLYFSDGTHGWWN